MVETFETDRVRAHPVREGDFDDLLRMHTDPAVMATLGGRLWTADETRAFIGRLVDHWDRYGYGVWTLRDKDTGRFLGRAGLRRKDIEGVTETELLYGLAAESWGRGLATEVARTIAGLAFDRLKLPSLVAFTLPTNRESRRVMEKTGFTYERDFIHAGLLHVLYRLRRPVTAAD
ncbi:GNAT family N-acetyltransferase [Azospirillum sp. sgz302134]